jgi:hypothetical protein
MGLGLAVIVRCFFLYCVMPLGYSLRAPSRNRIAADSESATVLVKSRIANKVI